MGTIKPNTKYVLPSGDVVTFGETNHSATNAVGWASKPGKKAVPYGSFVYNISTGEELFCARYGHQPQCICIKD